LPSVILLNYMYLLSENGGHGVDAGDIALHEHVLELAVNILYLLADFLKAMAKKIFTKGDEK
jgi:hypothetical protein